MEIRYKCTRQDVERSVVTANGDLEKAAESLRTLKPEETCDPSTSSTNKKVEVTDSRNLCARPHPKQNLSTATQQRRDEKDLNYSKSAVTTGGSLERVTESFQPSKRIQPKLEWEKTQQSEVLVEKRRPSTGLNPSVSYSLASPFQASPRLAKTESRHVAVVSDFKNILPSIREPVIMMQRSQSVNKKPVPATSTSTSPGTSFMYPTTHVEITKSNGFLPHIPSTRSLNSNNLSSSQMHHQLYHQQQQHFTSSSGPGDSPGTSRRNGLWSRTATSPTLAAASSLGFFTNLGSTTSSGATSTVDWSSGSSMAQLDYTNIDWSLDLGLSSSPRLGEIWLGPSTSPMKSIHMYYPNTNGLSAKPAMRLTPNGKGVPIVGLPDGGVATAKTSTVASHEWTSPFEGKDLFSLPQAICFTSITLGLWGQKGFVK